MKKAIVFMLALVIVFSSPLAYAEMEEDIRVIGDVLVLRPVGLASLVTGSAVFIVSLPIAAITGSTKTTYRTLVKEPFEYTFVRPVGEKRSAL